MSMFSIRLAKAKDGLPCGPKATDGFTSRVVPNVTCSGRPVTCHVSGEIGSFHKFLASPGVAENRMDVPPGSQASGKGLPRSADRNAARAPNFTATPSSTGVDHQSSLSPDESLGSGLHPMKIRCFP